MKIIRLALLSFCLLLSAIPSEALAKPVYLSCRTTDPDWPPPLKIIVDEDRGDVTISDPNGSGSSPNPIFTQDSVEFGFSGTRWNINRVNLTLTTTADYTNRYRTVCKLDTPPKRAF
jgi:hypothetical protein